MSHIIYCDESAEQSQVIRDSVRNEAAASTRDHTSSGDRLFGAGQTSLEQLLEASWPVWNRDRTDLLQEGTGPEIRKKCVAWCNHMVLAGLKQKPLALPCTPLAQCCANVLKKLHKTPWHQTLAGRDTLCLLALYKRTD